MSRREVRFSEGADDDLVRLFELLADKDQKISRPRQWYTGPDVRDFVPVSNR